MWVDELATPESLAWGMAHTRRAERARRWVATSGGCVLGWAAAGRATWTPGHTAYAYVGVAPDWRGRGIGTRLFAEVERHLARLVPERVLSAAERGGGGPRFLAAHGFRHTRDDQAWSVDPRAIDTSELPERRAAAERAGLRLVPVRSLLARPEDLYRLNLALEADLPSDLPIQESYGEWRVEELETPLFEPDASFCVLADDLPVAMTWIRVDHAGGRARHGMTGTLRPYRHRGLARLVKLASIAWLADHGVSVLFTDNDTENRDMLALNEHLGYRPATVFELWMRG